jgi:hypothetical protein
MNIEEDTLRKVLKECKLVQKNSKAAGTRFLSPALNAWDKRTKDYFKCLMHRRGPRKTYDTASW